MKTSTSSSLRIALVGNPNCGKTALFNALTGARQRVGNWPGVTVERKTGTLLLNHQAHTIVDLPGIYSLSVATSEGCVDERITCDYLLSDTPDMIINIIDASNLERNLYLTTQLLDLKIPIILVVNMLDVLAQRGMSIDLKKLGQHLGCPIVGTIIKRQEGTTDLKAVIAKIAKQLPSQHHHSSLFPLPKIIETAVTTLQSECQAHTSSKLTAWLALRLLEGDQLSLPSHPQLSAIVTDWQQQIHQQCGEDADILIANARYFLTHELTLAVTQLKKGPQKTLTTRIDQIVLNRYLGIPIFLTVMYGLFFFAINVAGALQDFFDISSATLLVDGTAHLLTAWHTPNWLIAILAHGIGKGINTTITFIPVIGGMFLFLSFLEDCGYMARAAFVMDRCMRAIGLPGKSFVPMIVGFGCNVPAIMGARTLANHRDRILTVLMMPFMSCGARLAIFAVFAAAFFPSGGQTIIFILYLLGILTAILTGLLLRKSLLHGEPSPMIMELPPYHVPHLASLLRQTWWRLKNFLNRAGKVIVPVCMLIGTANTLSLHGTLIRNFSNQGPSILAEVGKITTPILSPMGITENNWPATVGLLTGVLAKEVVIGTLNTLYSQENHFHLGKTSFDLKQGLRAAVFSIPQNFSALGAAIYNPFKAAETPADMNHAVYGVMASQFGSKIAAFSYLLFVLLYFPCISTLAAIRREIGNRWAYFSMGWSFVIAYGIAVLSYQILTFFQHPFSSSVWIAAIIASFFAISSALIFYTKKAAPRSPETKPVLAPDRNSAHCG